MCEKVVKKDANFLKFCTSFVLSEEIYEKCLKKNGKLLAFVPNNLRSADLCLSAITQKKGELTEWEISLMREHNTVWGCDVCQSVCPFNKEPALTPVSFFYEDRIPHLTREVLDTMNKPTFKKRAFAWRGRKTVERNLDILENTKKDN